MTKTKTPFVAGVRDIGLVEKFVSRYVKWSSLQPEELTRLERGDRRAATDDSRVGSRLRTHISQRDNADPPIL